MRRFTITRNDELFAEGVLFTGGRCALLVDDAVYSFINIGAALKPWGSSIEIEYLDEAPPTKPTHEALR